MDTEIRMAWNEGFKAGDLSFWSRCPYAPGSASARAWHQGWAQALIAFRCSDQGPRAGRAPAPRGWRGLLQRLRRPSPRH